ncbi:MAG TPA: glycosyltransferase family 4 protein [Verrucomicrobiae bacterium]|nr:glycosyltransferase family 4 protein [Verrucomicrobiae bacterium]
MRVTHVITRLIVGGAQENTIASVLGLRRIPGLEVDLISGPTSGPEGSLESDFAADDMASSLAPADGERVGVRGRPAPILTILPELVRPIHPSNDLMAFHKLKRIFRERRPDIVHTHSGKAGVLGRLAAAQAGVPVIVHTIHGPSFGAFQGNVSNWLFRSAEKRAARVTTHFVTVADAMRDQYLAAGIGRPEQYTRIFSGFPLEPFLQSKNDIHLRARYGLKPDDIVIGKIARLFKLKGHDTLFAVAPELIRACPQIKFLLVGDGAWRGRFEQMARASGLRDHYVFTGLVPPAEIPSLLGIMDVLVHLSEREGLARALPQALATGKPIIAFDCDGAREVCRDGETGFLVRLGHLNGLTERLLLLACDPALRKSLGERGREFVRANFAVEQMVQNIHRLYLQLANR